MKNFLSLLLILALVLPIVSCSSMSDDLEPEVEESQSIPESASESESKSEGSLSDTNSDSSSYYPITPAHFFYFHKKYDYEDYLKHMKSTTDQLHGQYVHFSDLDSLDGSLQLIEYDDISCYGESHFRYRLTMKSLSGYMHGSPNIVLTVAHGNFDEPELLNDECRDKLFPIYFREDYTEVTDHASNDLRYYRRTVEPVDYFCNGIRYTYVKGNLTEIHWQSGDTKFWFTFEEPLYSPTYDIENTGAWNDPLLKPFLHKDRTESAIAWFDELIEAPSAQ